MKYLMKSNVGIFYVYEFLKQFSTKGTQKRLKKIDINRD